MKFSNQSYLVKRMLESLSSRVEYISLLKTILYLNIERIKDVSIRILPKQLFKRFSRV